MPVKAILDVEMPGLDEAIAKFDALRKKLLATPGVTLGGAGAGGGGRGGRTGGGGGGGAGPLGPMAQNAQHTVIFLTQAVKQEAEVVKQTKTFASLSKYSAVAWKSIKDDAHAVGNSLKAAAGSVTRIAKGLGITSAIGSLVGLGGTLWGLEHLAAAASAGRRSSQGLGLTYGQQQAFATTYGRLLDPGAFLGGVGAGRGNLASPQAAALYALGINPAGPGNTGQQASQALARVRQLTLQTPEALLGTLLQTHRLGDLGLSLEDLRRIRSLSPQDFEKYQGDYAKRSKEFDISDPRMKAWQDLDVTLTAAGQKIKSTLIDGLAPLAKPIEQMSEAFADIVKALLGSQGFRDLMKSATDGLKEFAHYVGSPQFKDDVLTLARTVGELARGFARLLGVIPGRPMSFDEYKDKVFKTNPNFQGKDPNDPQLNEYIRQKYNEYSKQFGLAAPTGTGGTTAPAGYGNLLQGTGPSGIGDRPINNPGNLRPVGQSTGFQQFASPQAGLRAMANNLLYYQEKLGKQTIRDIVSTWAPSNENDTAAYIKNVSQWTRLGPDQKLDLHDRDTLANLMAAMIRQEGNGKNPNYQRPVIIEVLNNTGGNAIVSASNMGFPQ